MRTAIKPRSVHSYVQALAFVSRHQDSLRLRNKRKGETIGFLYSLFDTFTFLNLPPRTFLPISTAGLFK